MPLLFFSFSKNKEKVKVHVIFDLCFLKKRYFHFHDRGLAWLGGLLVLYTYNTRHALQAKIYAIFIVCMHDRPCHVYYLFLEDVIMDSWA